MDAAFWKARRVLLTGHTGFKGAWLAMCLQGLGAKVLGIALAPPTEPNAFTAMRCAEGMDSVLADIRDPAALQRALGSSRPEVIFHLAAQSLVKEGYADPVSTYATNVMGTVNVLQLARGIDSVRAIVSVTSDKCYENLESARAFRETDALGGHDPYGSSKACAEIVTAAYARSYFSAAANPSRPVCVASARAGNVIGGGDWAADRLVPDLVRGAVGKAPVLIRNPSATRPWQHVLEPLSGYLLLAQALVERGSAFSGAWNFGPADDTEQPVSSIADRFSAAWGATGLWRRDERPHPHEARQLKLDSTKARKELHWLPVWTVEQALRASADWYRAYYAHADMSGKTREQIDAYLARGAP